MTDIRGAALVRAMRQAGMLEDDLSARQIAVLAMAAMPAESLRSHVAIANATGIPSPAVTRATSAPAEAGLVRRVTCRRDLRVVFVEATEEGRRRLATLLDFAAPETAEEAQLRADIGRPAPASGVAA